MLSWVFYYYKIDSKDIISLKTIEWNSMFPLIHDWETKELLIDYYNTHSIQPKKWDIIAYNYAGNEKALIKIIQVTDNDSISFSKNRLIINDSILKNSVWEEYIFSEAEVRIMSLYINDSHIPKNSYFIFWDNTKNSLDSRNFWAISWEDIIWKFK